MARGSDAPRPKRRRVEDADDSEEEEEVETPPRRQGGSTKSVEKYTNRHLRGQLAISATGARAGDVVVGKDSSAAAGIRLEVVTGLVKGWGEGRELLGRDAIVKALARSRRLSTARAAQVFDDIEWDTFPNHQPLGKSCGCRVLGSVDEGQHMLNSCRCEPTCTFRLLEAGVLHQYAEETGNTTGLEEILGSQRAVSWRDILSLTGKHTLILRRGLYTIATGPQRTADVVGELVDLTYGIDASHMLDLSSSGPKVTVLLPVRGRTAGIGEEEAVRWAVEVLRGEGGEVEEEEVKVCRAVLSQLSIGGLKSAHQKVIRFSPRRVELSDGRTVSAGVFAVVCSALTFSHPGTFVPEIQTFTRGVTAALKRTMVTMMEDAWVDAGALERLGAAALLSIAEPTWHPHAEVVKETMRVSLQGLRSAEVCDWRWCRSPPSVGGVPSPKVQITQEEQASLKAAACMLRAAKSLPGDYIMADGIALVAGKRRELPMKRTGCRPDVMPLCHVIDFHAQRGIGHVARWDRIGIHKGKSGFESAFKAIFFGCTGVNARLNDIGGFEARPVVEAVREAQRLVLRLIAPALHPRQRLAAAGQYSCSLQLDPGTLAAAVGPLSVSLRRKPLVVTLGVSEPEEEVVMRKPSRDSSDLYRQITDAEREAALKDVRSRSLPLRSPFPIGKTARFAAGGWRLDGRPWAEVCAAGVTVTVPMHPSPGEWPGFESDGEWLRRACAQYGDGICTGAEEAVRRMCRQASTAVCRRAASLMQQQYEKVSMPTTTLDGRQSNDQLAAYDHDPLVWRFLAALSVVVPGALRADTPPRFSIPNPVLLRQLETWVREAAGGGDERGGTNQDRWRDLKVDARAMMVHQRDAVADMRERDENGAPGHFLVMDTGYGKTLTSLCYIRSFLSSTDSSIHSVLWVCPVELVAPTLKQLRERWGAPGCELPPDGKPRAGMINCVKHDRLRVVVGTLVQFAPRMICVFDEVDTMYAATKRTSAAHSIAAVAAKIVCQTATPLRNTKNEQLADWLARVERFPVDKRNWLVAANGIVSKQIDLGITVDFSVKEVPLTQEVRAVHVRQGRDWGRVAAVTQAATDDALVQQATERASEGVLVVSNDATHTELLLEKFRARGVAAGGFADRADPSKRVVVVTKRHCRGYNEATRLGVIVTGVYAGNGADRHQMTGRLRRLGQRRSKIAHVTVYMSNTILSLLHERHQNVDTMNISLEQLAQRYGHEVLSQLG
eukprot:Hpha_TRINITY_DN15445_c0_g6::TRINITY_DN15445_c0_g6_i1::g.175091::m.175091